MKKNQFPLTVRVIARNMEDLERLATDPLIEVHCGAAGEIIVQKVIEGKGVAIVKMNIIRMAIDTDCGHNKILDNFDLQDSRTSRPLLYQLITEKLEANRLEMTKG